MSTSLPCSDRMLLSQAPLPFTMCEMSIKHLRREDIVTQGQVNYCTNIKNAGLEVRLSRTDCWYYSKWNVSKILAESSHCLINLSSGFCVLAFLQLRKLWVGGGWSGRYMRVMEDKTKMLSPVSSLCSDERGYTCHCFKSRPVEKGTKCRCLILWQGTGKDNWLEELIRKVSGKKLSVEKVWSREETRC